MLSVVAGFQLSVLLPSCTPTRNVPPRVGAADAPRGTIAGTAAARPVAAAPLSSVRRLSPERRSPSGEMTFLTIGISLFAVETELVLAKVGSTALAQVAGVKPIFCHQ